MLVTSLLATYYLLLTAYYLAQLTVRVDRCMHPHVSDLVQPDQRPVKRDRRQALALSH